MNRDQLLLIKTEAAKPENLGKSRAENAALFNVREVAEVDYINKSAVNNYFSGNFIDILLQRVMNSPASAPNPNPEPIPHVDVHLPQVEGLSIREIAQSGYNFFLADTGEKVNPNNMKLRGCTTILEATGWLSTEAVAGFWDLFKVLKTRGEVELGISEPVTEADVGCALLMDRADELQTEVNAARVALSVDEYRLAQLRSGVDPDEVAT